MTDDKTTRMRELTDELNRASAAYYNGRGELMTDYEWDARFDELRQLEIETGTVLPDSPTHRVSADDVAGRKEAHEYPMLSLAKTKTVTELARWADGRPVWLSWKLDGLTLVVTFDGGRLTKVVTRGNGHTGTNITHLAACIGGLPQTIPYQGHVVIRGEAVISYADFERFNLESEEEYANPRNLASGSLTLKDAEEVRRRHLRWIPFTLVHTDEHIGSWGARMDWIEQNGMKVVERELVSQPTVDNIQAAVDRWTRRVTGSRQGNDIKTFPYPVDGLVIAYDDWDYSLTGSVTGHHATRAGLAFKWADESAETVLDHIEWSCAASTISPVAVFSPVELEGTTVKRASLCNISECERLGIGDKGTRLSVIKANKIIPKVVSVQERVGELMVPQACPVCGAPTMVSESETSMTKTLHCTNAHCPAKQLKKLARLVSKEGVNVDGLSEQTLQKLINLGWVKAPADIFHLAAHTHELSVMDGFGQKSVSNLLRAIERARQVEARRLLYALNIPLCGMDVCTRLLSAYRLEDLIRTARETADAQVFSTIDGIGPEKSASLVIWFKDETNSKTVEDLLRELNVNQPDLTPKGDSCRGLTFVVTGDVHHYKNRSELKAYIESQGGKVTGSVSKSTNWLINNDAASTSAKNQKARQLGIPIITEEEFVEKFGR